MKITMYDLLGLVKDGKAPKKIRYDDTIYEYSKTDDFYYCNGFSLYREFAANGNCLDKEVKILEKPKKIEKLNDKLGLFGDENTQKIINELNYTRIIINELIDEINNLKEK